MREELIGIVRDVFYDLAECVDLGELRAHTVSYDLSAAARINWERVEHLHILGTEELPDPRLRRPQSGWNKLLGRIADAALSNSTRLEKGCYVSMDGTWVLLAGLPADQIQGYVDRCTAHLELLDISFTDMTQLSLPALPNLEKLVLKDNSKMSRLQGVHELHALKRLDLWFSPVWAELDLNNFPVLRELTLSGSNVSRVFLDRPLESLSEIWIDFTSISDTRFLAHCPNLTALNLTGTSITHIPEGIRNMKHLRNLFLGNLKLKELPDWLPELGLHIGRDSIADLRLDGTTVEGMNMSIFDQPQDVILEWFEQQKKAKQTQEAKPLNEIKVVFLGDGEAGKSLTVARLLNDGKQPEHFDGNATPGIAIEDRDYDLPDGRHVQVHFWDFGGQEILHSMHRMFLTERTLYVVMINARDDTQDDRARYWLHNVKSFAKGCPVLMVLNKVDQNPNASIDERGLKTLYPELKQVIRLSALNFSREEFNNAFTAPMLELIGSFESLGTFFPPAWQKLKLRLQNMTEPYIRGPEYAALSEECGVEGGESIRKTLLNWFNDLGVSFCYRGSARLEDYVILRPEWITNAVYTILWNKRDEVVNGIISAEEIHRLLHPSKEERARIRQVRPDLTYSMEETEYVLNVVRRFRLSYLVRDNMEFVPMLCQRNSLPIAEEYAKMPDTLEFRMEYEYLPNNVLHRLMVDLRQDLDTSQVWLTGARFRQERNGISAVVRSEGNILRIFVRSENPLLKRIYLNAIRGALDAIHKDLGLAEPEALVVYKKDGREEEFVYETLVGALDSGMTDQYSRVWKRPIPIEDILNQTDSSVEQQRQKLLQDIATACAQMQGRKPMWKASEDDRNDSLRDSLRNMGYIISDQTHQGVGSGGKRAGAPDLMILRETNLPWTICEALNVKGASKDQFDKWDEHLNRLLDNYDPAGMPMQILISYVECGKDRYHALWSAYSEHMRWHDPDGCERRSGTYGSVPALPEQFHYLQTVKCTYDRAGMPVTVYHFFVRMGDRKKGSHVQKE